MSCFSAQLVLNSSPLWALWHFPTIPPHLPVTPSPTSPTARDSHQNCEVIVGPVHSWKGVPGLLRSPRGHALCGPSRKAAATRVCVCVFHAGLVWIVRGSLSETAGLAVMCRRSGEVWTRSDRIACACEIVWDGGSIRGRLNTLDSLTQVSLCVLVRVQTDF